MAHKYSFSKIKEHILSQGSLLKFEGISKNDLPEKNIDDFMSRFFYYNAKYRTVYAANGAGQTPANKRRSVADIYRIVRYYFPNASLTKLYKRLTQLVKDNVISSAFCEVIGKRVYRKRDGYENTSFFNGTMTDEYGVDFEEFDLEGVAINEHGWGTDYDEDVLKPQQL